MCGIFGIISNTEISRSNLKTLAIFAERRGKDSSGLIFSGQGSYNIVRSDQRLLSLLESTKLNNSKFVMGHSRLITNGSSDNQPIYRDNVCVVHNGIVVNADELWGVINKKRRLEIDTEVIAAIVSDCLEAGAEIDTIPAAVLSRCRGVVACAVALPRLGKLCLFSNNGSLYIGNRSDDVYFSSEKFPLEKIFCENIKQVREEGVFFEIPTSELDPEVSEKKILDRNLIPKLGSHLAEEKQLEYRHNSLRRCTKCILPETMPFICFDDQGVCNYCKNYKKRNHPKPIDDFKNILERYRRNGSDDCIVPFSGGRDSCFALHLIARELKMKPITYTYDWGMVTDLGRRNISRMSARLGVENIIVADDISLKRRNIAKNFSAWLKSPNLGMVSILTAGDKHFFRYIETVKLQTGISLNLWGINPLEVTHFKAGFLGVPPDFAESKVYSSGMLRQLKYQFLRFSAMLESPDYFNGSLFDTISGEYYRSFAKKEDYYHVFDFWRWDEKEIDSVLLNDYDWELAPDTKTTWRIGDGTAAMYNYIYYTIAGFTEHDTFRSNQIREGDISRDEALSLVFDENRPRYPNIKWYLDAIGLDFNTVINIINRTPKLPGVA